MTKIDKLSKCIWEKINELDYDPMNASFEHLDNETKNKINTFSESMLFPSKIANDLQEHQQRVAIEKAELDKKAKALSDFIGTSQTFTNIDAAEQERLKEQCEIMWQLSEVLGQRIAAFK